MSNFEWCYYTLSFTCSLCFQWPWRYFKVLAVSDIFNWKCYVLVRLSWNFVGLLSTSNRSGVYRSFWLWQMFKGHNWHVSWFNKNFIVGYFIFWLMKNVSLCNNDQWYASQLSVCGKNFYIAIFLDTINMINVKLCMMVVLIEL